MYSPRLKNIVCLTNLWKQTVQVLEKKHSFAQIFDDPQKAYGLSLDLPTSLRDVGQLFPPFLQPRTSKTLLRAVSSMLWLAAIRKYLHCNGIFSISATSRKP
jgi:hypothetical protein